MSKFNATHTPRKGQKVTNNMGEVAFTQSLKEELAFLCVTSFVENTYYESSSKQLDRLRTLVKDISKRNPKFIGQLAVYARTKANMRSIFHVLVGELARNHNGDDLVQRTITNGVTRVDDMTEIVSYLKSQKFKSIPNQVKKGLRNSFYKFDEYQLGKYRAGKKDVSLVDVVNLVHPKPVKKNSSALRKLVAGTLRSKDTWEKRISDAGKFKNKEVAKAEAWADLLRNRKMNVMAILRNLRNILETNDPELVDLACKALYNKTLVQNSRQLPFRFLSAYKEVSKLKSDARKGTINFEYGKTSNDLVQKTLDAIEIACLHATENIPLLEGQTVILTDNSGSMYGDSSRKSAVSAYSSRKTSDIANLFSLLYWYRAENTYVGVFGDNLQGPKLDRNKGVFENFKIIDDVGRSIGGGTEQGIYTAFRGMIREDVRPNRIVIFSDCQIGRASWFGLSSCYRGRDKNETFAELLKRFQDHSPHTQIFCVNLRGYGNTVFNGNVVEVAGWSDKIFELLKNNYKAALV